MRNWADTLECDESQGESPAIRAATRGFSQVPRPPLPCAASPTPYLRLCSSLRAREVSAPLGPPSLVADPLPPASPDSTVPSLASASPSP